jgi:hypothetical protein
VLRGARVGPRMRRFGRVWVRDHVGRRRRLVCSGMAAAARPSAVRLGRPIRMRPYKCRRRCRRRRRVSRVRGGSGWLVGGACPLASGVGMRPPN